MRIICKDQKLSKELKAVIRKQPIYWSDLRLCHYIFDFKYNDVWVSSKRINNELTEMEIELI